MLSPSVIVFGINSDLQLITFGFVEQFFPFFNVGHSLYSAAQYLAILIIYARHHVCGLAFIHETKR